MNRLGDSLKGVATRYQARQPWGAARGVSRLVHGPANPPRYAWRMASAPAASGSRAGLTRRARLEAVLLLAREPLALRKLAQLANLTDGTEARTLLAALRRAYDERGCAFQVEQVAGGYQLLTRPKFAPWLRPLGANDQELRLSSPALETLAVVAYRQPVLRAEIEAIRGVACGEILRQLMDRDLLRIAGRSEELGRPLYYGTTKRFLRVFGLCNLDQLPLASQLRRTSGGTDLSTCATPRLPDAQETSHGAGARRVPSPGEEKRRDQQGD